MIVFVKLEPKIGFVLSASFLIEGQVTFLAATALANCRAALDNCCKKNTQNIDGHNAALKRSVRGSATIVAAVDGAVHAQIPGYRLPYAKVKSDFYDQYD